MKTGNRIFLVCALGAFIGSALSVWCGWSLWLGMVIGGSVAYLVYLHKAIWQWAPIAARRSSQGIQEIWRDMPSTVSSGLWHLCVVLGDCLLVIAGLVVISGLFLTTIGGVMFYAGSALAALDSGFTTLSIIFTLGIFGNIVYTVKVADLLSQATSLKELLIWNPITVIVPTAYVILRTIYRLGIRCYNNRRAIVTLMVEIAAWPFRFGWHLFKLVHSDQALICLVDAAIGVVIGFYFWNPFIGALAGGVLGKINYELVSVRWLKLAPKRV